MTLAKLQYDSFLTTDGMHDDAAMETWRKSMLHHPNFHFWDLILRYETLILVFIRAHREKKFYTYIEALEALIPLFFALNHTNYARWCPVHVRDMKSLPPSVKSNFEKGNWVIQKTRNVFSAMPIDQAHEQENKMVKEAGAIGLADNQSAFR